MDRIMRLSLRVRIAEEDGDKAEAKAARLQLRQAILALPIRPGHQPLDPSSAQFRGLMDACLEIADSVMNRTQEILEMSFADNQAPAGPARPPLKKLN